MILSDRKYLALPLPEDIEKRKMSGNFAEARKLIKLRLAGKIPASLKKRLEIEEEILSTIEHEYPYDLEEALAMVQKDFPAFTAKDLQTLLDENAVDWYLIDGKIRLIGSFLDNLTKVHHPILKEDLTQNEAFRTKQNRLNDTMADMKKNGGAAYRFKIRESLKLHDDQIQDGKEVLVHLPIPTLAAPQVKNVKILSHSNLGEVVIAPEDYASRTISFRVPAKQGQEFFVEYSFENHTPYVELDPDKASENQPEFSTEEQAPHILFTPFIQELYKEIVGNETNPVKKARLIYDYITTNIRYSFMRPYSSLNNIPEYAAVNGKGDCGVQALLFITLCRCGHIPAKWQSGLYVPGNRAGSHDWARFYIEPYGWVFADLSFGGSSYRAGNEERRLFYFGNLDPFRMPANAEFEHEFFPAKKFTRNDPTDNQKGEAEYENHPLLSYDYDTEQTILAIEKIPFEK